MKGLLNETLLWAYKKGKTLVEVKKYLRNNYNIKVSLRVLKNRIKNNNYTNKKNTDA